MNKKLIIISVLLLLMISQTQATELDIGYDSKYVSEGRNQLFSGGIYWINGSHDIDENVSIAVAYGVASNSDVNYDELNLSISYANSADGFDYYAAYTRLEFFEDNASDDEISFGAAYTEFESFTPFSNFVYGLEADGFFIDIGAEKEFQLSNELFFTPYAIITFDYGYAGGGKNGHNHTYFGARVNYTLTQNATIGAIFEQTFGGSVIAKEGNKTDLFWSGVHFIYSW